MAVWKKLENKDRQCFGCGLENKNGLQMKFETNGEKIRSEIVIPKYFRGWSRLAHGGIISTILDETMSWTAVCFFRRFILTQNMSVRFRRPVYIDSVLTSTGWIKEKVSDKKAVMCADLRDEKGKVCATSEGRFVLFDTEEFKRLEFVDKNILDEIKEFFN
ncbi:MAG: hypothetical protein CSA18_02865 [Deltaproteobacteria bacterium]|nr:MAG: hypothetical protein CSA18_02865 [Deltaproteobacteria bacterium]